MEAAITPQRIIYCILNLNTALLVLVAINKNLVYWAIKNQKICGTLFSVQMLVYAVYLRSKPI